MLINLFILMVPADMPELSSLEDIQYLRTMLSPNATTAEALERFEKELEDALNSKMKRLDNAMHIVKHSRG